MSTSGAKASMEGNGESLGCSLTTGPDAAEVAHGKIRAVQNYLTSRISQLSIRLTTGDKWSIFLS